MRKTVGQEYAVALFEMSNSLEQFHAYIEELELLADAFDTNSEIPLFLAHPKISKEEKKDFIHSVFQTKNEAVLHFVYVLVDNERILELREVIHQLKTMYYEKNHSKHFDIYSIHTLTSKERKIIENTLEQHFNTKAHLSYYIDKNLLGGLKIVYNGSVLEYSVLDNLKSIKEILKNKKLR